MARLPGLTSDELAALCQRAFPDRTDQQLEAILPISSRQHEVVAFQLRWQESGTPHSEALIARRYISTISWWRRDDRGKAQREATVTRWLFEQGFPVPEVYAREIGILGDVTLYGMLPGHDWTVFRRPFPEVVFPLVGEFARLLANLHVLKPPESVTSVVPRVTLPTALANLSALAQQIEHTELQDIVRKVMDYAFNVTETGPVLLHGDYHFSNAILDQDHISGIVDWEFCALGDPRWDVANAYMQLVDFDAASAAQLFLETYLHYTGWQFDDPPVYNVVVPLQQWAVSEWLVSQGEDQRPEYRLAGDLVTMRDMHRSRALASLHLLDLE